VNRSPNPTVGSGTSARCLPRCSTGRTDVISYVRSVVSTVLSQNVHVKSSEAALCISDTTY